MNSHIDLYNYCEFIPTSILCTKCNNYSNINISTNCTEYSLNEITKTFLCINCSNNLVDKQNIIHYVNDQINSVLKRNCISFSKINSKINTLSNNISKINLHTSNYDNINNKFENMDKKFKLNNFLLTDMLKKIQTDIIFLNNYVNKNDENTSELNSKYNDLNELVDIHTHNYIQQLQEYDESNKKIEKRLKRFDLVIKLSQKKLIDDVNRIKKNIDSYYKFGQNLESKILKIEKSVNKINNLENTFEEKLKDLNENIKSYYLKNKELKELKRNLILNDKEYKSFKSYIKKINNNLIYFYLLILFNISFFLFSIYFYLK